MSSDTPATSTPTQVMVVNSYRTGRPVSEEEVTRRRPTGRLAADHQHATGVAIRP